MSKTTAGIVLVAGIGVVMLGVGIRGTGHSASLDPADDWYYSMVNYAGLAVGLLGIGMFFAGALRFARG